MSDETTHQTVDIFCAEEQRTAHLLVELRRSEEGRQVVGIECDNPRLADHHRFECRWSCWSRVEEALDAVPSDPEG